MLRVAELMMFPEVRGLGVDIHPSASVMGVPARRIETDDRAENRAREIRARLHVIAAGRQSDPCNPRWRRQRSIQFVACNS